MTAQSGQTNLEQVTPDQVFDGGDLDCGSGLILLIRENMLKVQLGGILEMRSSEPTVADDLPPWCRMSGHHYLGQLEGKGYVRYFIRRGEPKSGEDSEQEALQKDKEQAKEYEWRVRTRSTGHLESTVYCRNFSWKLGQPVSFEEKDTHPCAVEAMLGALGSSLSTAYATECSKSGLEIDDIEITVRARLINVLAHLGLEDGDPGFSSIEVKCFASTMDDETKVRQVWEQTVKRSPIAVTLAKATQVNIKLLVV
ncbi:sulfurtransferase TusA family protein [Desulfonatronovibrio hydrogenovorans]|uniref:sulfurtransferase TusA family protein n=1 Tax=Desulfonatronovibrio hydrogenovorans TaxID=53245 RepID=UPI0006924788|nr:OsmC family protein [Desulfonatronovibrio hydrogenovorans]